METFVLRWTKDNLPFWQGVDDGEKIEINAVADVINENAKLKRAVRKSLIQMIQEDRYEEPIERLCNIAGLSYPAVTIQLDPISVADVLLTKETNDDQATSKERSTRQESTRDTGTQKCARSNQSCDG